MNEEKKVKDATMIFTMCCAATYCLTITAVTGYYAFNATAFNAGFTEPCYAKPGT
jgi:uncharacterized membrane protein